MKKDTAPLRALIVEDEGLTVMQLRQALAVAGYSVVGEAMDGQKGRQQDEGKYTVVWQKLDGNWKVSVDMFSSNLPAPGSQ